MKYIIVLMFFLTSLSFASDPSDLECCYFLGTRDLTDADLFGKV